MFTKTKKLIAVAVVAAAAAAALLWLVPHASQAQAPPPSQAISAPTLTAIAGEEAIDLSWNAVENAVRYELMVWWDPLPNWQPFGGNNLTATSYTHTGLTAGRKYYYTIRAVNAADKKSGWQQDFASATAHHRSPESSPVCTPQPTYTPYPTSTPYPTYTPVPPAATPVNVDPCANIGGDGCKFWLRNVEPADNGGGELKLIIGFVHGGRNDEVQIHGGYFVELQKDGVQVAGFDHNTRAGTNIIAGPQGRIYNYSNSVPASQLPRGKVGGTYTIWVKDGNGERDSQNYNFTLPEYGNQGLVWLIFDQRPR